MGYFLNVKEERRKHHRPCLLIHGQLLGVGLFSAWGVGFRAGGLARYVILPFPSLPSPQACFASVVGEFPSVVLRNSPTTPVYNLSAVFHVSLRVGTGFMRIFVVLEKSLNPTYRKMSAGI